MLKPSLDKRERWIRNPLDEDYNTDNERVSRKIAQRADEWQEMTRFVATDECLMQFMRRSLGDTFYFLFVFLSSCGLLPQHFHHRLNAAVVYLLTFQYFALGN